MDELTAQIEAAVTAGLTPIIIDENDGENRADTFFEYGGNALQLDAKHASLEVAKGTMTVEQGLEECRKKLVGCIKAGKVLAITCQHGVPSFSDKLNSEDAFPGALVFKGAGKGCEE